jgi:hypothetical protein
VNDGGSAGVPSVVSSLKVNTIAVFPPRLGMDRVKAQMVQFNVEDDSDIHLILFSQGKYMIAEMPSAAPACRGQHATGARFVAARTAFVRRCGAPSTDFQPLGAVALVSGVGFWDRTHGQSGAARNYA